MVERGSGGARVNVQLITMEDCQGGPCGVCRRSEDLLRAVLRIAGIPFPDHDGAGRGEAYMDERRSVEVAHLPITRAPPQGLDPRQAPYLFVDGHLVLKGHDWERQGLADVLLDALFPRGLAGMPS